MLSFRQYLRGNKDRSTLTRLRQFQTPFPDNDYGPKNEPGPSSDANNLSAAMGLGMGGEGEEVVRKMPYRRGVNRFFPKSAEDQEMNMQNAVPGDAKVRDRSYEEPRPDSPVSNNHADRNADADFDAEHKPEEPVDLNDILPQHRDEAQPEDPNKQGLIRRVPGAHLVFKRKGEDGTYQELWVYKIAKDMREDSKIREQILAATDIPIEKMRSEDGTQEYDLWTVGDVQMMNVTGLPN